MSEENTKRFQFTFYESFYSAIKELDDKIQQAELYNAIAEYSLYGTEPDFKGILKMAWILIKPNLEVSRRKAEAGKKGGQIKQNESTNNNDNYNNLSKTQASCKQTDNKTQANDKQTTNKNENACSKSISYIEREREEEREDKREEEREDKREIKKEIEEKYKKQNSKEKNSKKETFDFSFLKSEEEKQFLKKWLDYKKERRESYKTQSSIEECFTHLVNLSNGNIGIAQAIINQSIANNWSGLFPLKNQTSKRQAVNNDEPVF